MSTFKGHQVWFLKRAQILIADIWACFENTGLGTVHDIDSLTMFADYRVPQILHHLGALQYSESLINRLKMTMPLDLGETEAEIRGCSIWAVERIREELIGMMPRSHHVGFNAVTIDFYLWDTAKARSVELENVPIHRIRTPFY